jgi:hypothetical protein
MTDLRPEYGDTQDGPRLDQNERTDSERIDGILVQTRADLSGADVATVEKSLRTRLSDAGFALDDDEIAALARDLASGSAGSDDSDAPGAGAAL